MAQNAVGLPLGSFRFIDRNNRMHSLMEVNAALRDVVSRLNHRAQSRFKVPLLERFNALAKEYFEALHERNRSRSGKRILE